MPSCCIVDSVADASPVTLPQELEEDPEMRSKVALYKDPAHKPGPPQDMDAMTDGDDEDDLPDIPLEELLDDMNALQLEENAQGRAVTDEDEDMNE